MTPVTDNTVLVGLTGSIGAGKSAVADLFEEAGIPVLRADLIARELMTDDQAMREEIVAAFGTDAYRDGELDRAWLARQVFADRQKLARLNEIVHPRTIAAQGMRARRLFDEGSRVVACEAALIFETGGEGRFDYIVVVDADPEIRLARAAGRDGSSLEQVRARDAMQMSAQHKVERADFVIRNNGDLEQLRASTAFVISLLKALPPRERLEIDDEGADADDLEDDDVDDEDIESEDPEDDEGFEVDQPND
ncbi:MAG TPA: dephospho-CoA kinase [Candidatus Kapabacteria bacterium]|jgi:dephospho-CoA kinase|nr:dephospho-CoA kinase [Candidatus Kapabacteria bacterium]